MNAVQKATMTICAGIVLLVILFPDWRQRYQGHLLLYGEHLGRHFLLSHPAATGEDSWILKAPASQCQVVVNRGQMFWEIGWVLIPMGILLFAFRGRSVPTMTRKSLVLTSLFLALCLPIPPDPGLPLAVWVGTALASPFVDSGHVSPWFAPMVAGVWLPAYFVLMLLVVRGVLWLAQRARH